MPGAVTRRLDDWADLPEGPVGLAVSGGADSLALLVVASRRADRERFTIYSVDHGLRPEAAEEVRFVLDTAARFGLPAKGLRWAGAKPATGLQAAARTARYRLIGDALAADGATVLVTAHHARDQAETLLMRLAHGSGLDGLRGMARWSEIGGIRLFRPFLATSPEALAEIVREAGLTPVADPSNEDSSYERVRWRKLLPLLAREGLTEERLVTLAARIDHAQRLVEREADLALDEVGPGERGGTAIPLLSFRALNRAVAVTLLSRVIQSVSGRSAPPLSALEGLVDRLCGEGPVAETLGGTTIRREDHAIVIRAEGPRRRGLKPSPRG